MSLPSNDPPPVRRMNGPGQTLPFIFHPAGPRPRKGRKAFRPKRPQGPRRKTPGPRFPVARPPMRAIPGEIDPSPFQQYGCCSRPFIGSIDGAPGSPVARENLAEIERQLCFGILSQFPITRPLISGAVGRLSGAA